MATHLILHDCPPPLRESLSAYWDTKQPRIETLLKTFPEDQRHLRISVSITHERYSLRGVLVLPTGTLVAESTAPTLHAAMDEVVDCLVQQIRRHRESIRRDDVYRRRRSRRDEWAQTLPVTKEGRLGRGQADFFDLVRPMLRGLHDYVARELALAQLEGTLRRGDRSVSDVFDEAVALAYERFGKRPADRSIESWLVELIHLVLDEFPRRHPHVSALEGAAPSGDQQTEADEGWQIESEAAWGRLSPLTLEDVFPADVIPEPWHEAEVREQRRWILKQLRAFPRQQRRAFTLSVLEGWDTGEIAALQSRSTEEVNADIEGVRDRLRTRLLQMT